MLCRVPRRRVSWRGTGTVIVVPSAFNCIMRWLPCCRTAMNPCCSRILQTSMPERTRTDPTGTSTCVTKTSLRNLRTTSDCDAVAKNSVSASTRLARASSMVAPWLAMSNSGHRETKPSSSRSMMAVRAGESKDLHFTPPAPPLRGHPERACKAGLHDFFRSFLSPRATASLAIRLASKAANLRGLPNRIRDDISRQTLLSCACTLPRVLLPQARFHDNHCPHSAGAVCARYP